MKEKTGFKRVLATIISVFTMLAVLLPAGCSSGTEGDTPALQESDDADNPVSQESAVLVAVFSCTGHTMPIAGYITDELGADLYVIEAEIPYTEEDIKYYTDCRADREQNNPEARPEIAGDLPDVSGYSTVFLGYPIWHGQAPKIIYTFLEGVDLSGKTVIPFCTSASSPLGTSAENLQALAPDAVWQEGRRFAIGTAAEEISEWIQSLNVQPE
ncbi:MAG: flavodoxin [Solobacterium sp.]|nr:flavodoxin [Solobacterium sp.]